MTLPKSRMEEICATMLALLLWKPGITPATGLETMTADQRLMLWTTCAARIIEQVVCETAQFDKVIALKAFNGLAEDVTRHIEAICNDAYANGKRYTFDLDRLSQSN